MKNNDSITTTSGDCCVLCGLRETSGHILWGCHYAKAVWSGTKIKLPWLQDPINDFVDIVWEIMTSHPRVDWTLFAVTAWSIWNNRNMVIHEGKCKGNGVLIRAVAEYVAEIRRKINLRYRSPLRPKVPGLLLDRIGIRLIQMVRCSGSLGAAEVGW